MGRMGRSRYLSCFYCGKQSSLKYDGKTTSFLCPSCNATNYLDENGDITDPPVATDREATPWQYARPQPVAAETECFFCDKCLKNQRLFTASLAQYLPDDPSHPDYAELDRNYYRYRRNLEKRYPQVCDECADRVQDRIRQAGYTAKTDHLRRMMDKSRGRRATPRLSPLHALSSLGGWLWRGGLVAQLLWHMVYVAQALEHSDDGMYDPDDTSMFAKGLVGTKAVLAWLPDSDALIRISIVAAILSSWWNPHFAQFARGFTRHLLGFTRWYSFQGLIIFFRILFRSVLTIDGGAWRSQSAQLSAHVATAGLMCFIYILASKSITVDTTPLFRTDDKPMTPRRAMTPAKRKGEDSKTLSELFNEALDSTPQRSGISSQTAIPDSPNYGSESTFVPRSQGYMQQQGSFNNSLLANSASILQQQPQPPSDLGDEMDWSPSQPQHRAFRYSSQQDEVRKPFGQSPTMEDGKKPFWFKVPPAPSNPARQLRNPPNMPMLRKKPMGKDQVFFRSRGDDGGELASRGYMGSSEAAAAEGKFWGASTSFKNPSFFAPERDSDEANSLADLLGQQSFSVSKEAVAVDGHQVSSSLSSSSSSETPGSRWWWTCDGAGLVGLLVLVPFWLVTMAMPWFPYGRELRGVLLVGAGVVALNGTSEAAAVAGSRRRHEEPKMLDWVLSGLGMVELAGVCWVGWETWMGRKEVGLYGAGVLVLMLGHYVMRVGR